MRRRSRAAVGLDQDELRLPGADQLEIDLGQELGVEQRAVLGAARIVDAVARAQIVEAVGPGRVLAARQQQRVDQPLARDQRLAGALELGIEEAEIERGVVRDQRRVADECEEVVGDLGEQRLVLEELGREAVDRERPRPACRARD